MQLQAVTNYAIWVLGYLHTSTDEMQAGTEIADAVGLTYPVFVRVAMKLRQAGYLVSIKGRTGGYMLGKSVDEMSLYDIFQCMQGEPNVISSLNETFSQEERTSKIYGFLQEMQEEIVSEMSQVSIAQLI